MNRLYLLFFIFLFSDVIKAQEITVSGYVYDKADGEALSGVTIKNSSSDRQTQSNAYGFYSITLPAGSVGLELSLIGYVVLKTEAEFIISQSQNFYLNKVGSELKGVTFKSKNTKLRTHVEGTQMGRIDVPMNLIKKVPTFAGESDLIKVLQLMPGVKRGSEAGTGLYVRGGSADQNLILLDEATVYNAGHLLGFFSVFNSNSIKEVTMYKGSAPAEFGGRLSSVLDIRMKEGNDQKFEAEGSLGMIASNLTIQGPIIKDKMSFILSGRRTYLDKVIQWTFPSNVFRLPYYFYDLNAKVNYKVNERDRIYFSSYTGKDVLYNNGSNDELIPVNVNTFLGNLTFTARWNHYYKSRKLFHNLSLIHSRFRYNIQGDFLNNSVLIQSSINDVGAKLDYDYRPNARHSIRFGGQVLNHHFRPNLVSTTGSITDYLSSRQGKSIYTQEWGLYITDDWRINSKFTVNSGLRTSGTFVQKAEYAGIEPRLSFKYSAWKGGSIKGGYSRNYQYLHLVSSSSVALPTDLWYPVTAQIRPGIANQFALGFFHSLMKQRITLSIEGYYKKMNNLLEYREGAVLFLNDTWENELVKGKGEAYGLEFLIQKDEGKLSGWISYTLGWATRTFSELNGGKTFYDNYDRRHDLSVVSNYEVTKRFSVSAAWVYSSGRPFTPLIGQYFMPNPTLTGVDLLPVYGERNQYRLRDAHRLDLDVCFKSKKKKKLNSEFHFSFYNIYNRTQPNRLVITQGPDGKLKYQEKGLFGGIWTLGWNFKI